MSVTSTKVIFGDLTFEDDEIKSASLVESFDPIAAKLPAGSLDLTIFSPDKNFSSLNPYRTEEELKPKQPLTVYSTVDGAEYPIGLYFLDDWESVEEDLVRLRCIDQIGLLDTLNFNGGMYLTPVTIDSLLAAITEVTDVEFEIDPDLTGSTITGWLPIGTCRQALQQICFAIGAYALSARQEGFIKVGILDSVYGEVYKGRGSCGVFKSGQSRNWQQRWRPASWQDLTFQEITEDMQGMGQPISQRVGVTGVEVYAHNYTAGMDTIDLFGETLQAGQYKLTFEQPVHTLVITGATEVESGANYVIINVATPGAVTVSGKNYIDSVSVYSQHMADIGLGKVNVLKVQQATMVSSTNASDVVSRVYDYYQLRFSKKIRLYAQPQIFTGTEIYANTLYTQRLRGWVENMRIDLANGFIADTTIIGDIEIPIYELYSGIFGAGESRIRQRAFRPTIGYY